jgi:hypothetical protein
MHSKDLQSFQRQTGLRNPEQKVIDEYEIAAAMLSRDNCPLPIGPVAMQNLLRRLNYAAPTTALASESKPIEWGRVAAGTRIISNKDPKNPRQGVVVTPQLNGCVLCRLDGDPALRSIGHRYLELAAVDNSDPWKSVEVETPVTVTINKQERDAKFLGVVDAENVRVLLKSGVRIVAKGDVKLTTLVAV